MSQPGFISRGFFGRRRTPDTGNRVPPGQHLVNNFPVLSAGPTPRIALADWSFTITGLVDAPVSWSWDALQQLPARDFVVDIHCVTSWSKLDTRWRGVSLDDLLAHVTLAPDATHIMAYSYGGYTTNLPISEIINGQAFIAYAYDDKPLSPEHGGPVRMVVPHLYFWKSAKWIQGIQVMSQNRRGFWESLGYNDHGDPWKEERYSGD